MNKRKLVLLFFISLAVSGWSNTSGLDNVPKEKKKSSGQNLAVASARNVLRRVLGVSAEKVQLELLPASEGTNSYEYASKNGKLILKGSNSIALTRGMYDYLRNQHMGMLSWSGPSFRLPKTWPDISPTKVSSPFTIRHAYNAVTPGYTTPYWDWKRWEQELDWQAMHGFNMLMAPIATEAIATRVWKRLGLTQPEIDEFYVGPAHLPWQRMGNICNVGGTLSAEWHTDQIALQHKVLKRMRELGMQPVVQSFAGFVPKAIKRIYPDIVLHSTLWNSGFPESQRPVLLMPGDPLFARITNMYMEEWQKEFGKEDYYLVDSFNEMELPKTDRPVTDLLAEYGEKTFAAICSGNPDAVWVVQGWMFGYQPHIWSPERVKALFSKVPDNRVLILDYANDYANNWEPMNGFNGKQWVYGFVPNMGGKTAYTGDMSLYATGAGNTLASPQKNNLVGFTISGEGLENNEVLYELMTDVAWSHKPVELDNWLPGYSKNRYGACPPEMMESWNLLRKSSYKSLEPHPQLGWQLGRCGYGSVNRDPEFQKSTELFLACASQLGLSSNYRADAIERTAISLGLKADEWFKIAAAAYDVADLKTGDLAEKRGLELLTELDRLMESHPVNRLERWIKFSQQHSKDAKLNKFYESNARQIVTIWGPPVNDYSCRIWSGLVRDFYRGRMEKILESLKTGKPFDRKKWEQNWVDASGVSKIEPYANPVMEAQKLLARALSEKMPVVDIPKGETIGNWSPANVSDNWKELEWVISPSQLKSMKGIGFMYTSGRSRLDIREVSVIADGKVVATTQHEGFAGIPSKQNFYFFDLPAGIQGNNGCSIRATVRSHEGDDSRGRVELIGN